MREIQSRLLSRRLHEGIRQQPEIKALRRLLLRLGGVELVAPDFDPAVQRLIDSGFVMAGEVYCKGMRAGRCHENVARLWAWRRHGIIGIGTGYALTGDNLWRQHSWGLLREGILETTQPRKKYFGILLQGTEADGFSA